MAILVVKRSGAEVDFDENKIMAALQKAGVPLVLQRKKIARQIAIRVFSGVTVEEIQNLVEEELMREGLHDTAKGYILYRYQHSIKRIPHCLEPSKSFAADYPKMEGFADHQFQRFYWKHSEIDLRGDIHEILTKLPQGKRDAIIEQMKIFTHYELKLGNEYWGGRYKRIFKRHEFQAWASVAACFENIVHFKFYRAINDELHLQGEEFFNSVYADPELHARMVFISEMVAHENHLVSLAAFTLLEGVSLFGQFAFFKSFQSNGNNSIPELVSGINFSVRDEALHAEVGAYSYNTLRSQTILSSKEDDELTAVIVKIARTLYEHEIAIAAKTYGDNAINGCTIGDVKDFIHHRIFTILQSIGIGWVLPTAPFGENPIKNWFYDSVDSYIYTDTFAKVNREYSTHWVAKKFQWRAQNERFKN